MPFPLPVDPYFRKEIVNIWILDVYDRLELGDINGAAESWRMAYQIYLSLPPGEGSESTETALVDARVKLDRFTQQSPCEQFQETLEKPHQQTTQNSPNS